MVHHIQRKDRHLETIIKLDLFIILSPIILSRHKTSINFFSNGKGFYKKGDGVPAYCQHIFSTFP